MLASVDQVKMQNQKLKDQTANGRKRTTQKRHHDVKVLPVMTESKSQKKTIKYSEKVLMPS